MASMLHGVHLPPEISLYVCVNKHVVFFGWIASFTEDQQRINTFSKLNARVKGFDERVEELKVRVVALRALCVCSYGLHCTG